jgi:hypothetical protein
LIGDLPHLQAPGAAARSSGSSGSSSPAGQSRPACSGAPFQNHCGFPAPEVSAA